MTNIAKYMPEASGEYSMFLPVNAGMNPNILIASNVSKEFIRVFNECIKEKSIICKPTTTLVYIMDGAPIFDMNIVTTKSVKTEKNCWMPVIVKTGENFPVDIRTKFPNPFTTVTQ